MERYFAFFILTFTIVNAALSCSQFVVLVRKKSVETMNIFFFFSLLISNTALFEVGIFGTSHTVFFELFSSVGSFELFWHVALDHILVWNGLLSGIFNFCIVVGLLYYERNGEQQKFDPGLLLFFVSLWFIAIVEISRIHNDQCTILPYCLYIFFCFAKARTVYRSKTRGSLSVFPFVGLTFSGTAWVLFGIFSERFWLALAPFLCVIAYLLTIYFWWKKPKYENTF